MLERISIKRSEEIKAEIEVKAKTNDKDIISKMKHELEKSIGPVSVNHGEDGYPRLSIRVDSYLESYFYNEITCLTHLKSIIMSVLKVEVFKDVRISFKPVVYCPDIHVDKFNMTFGKGAKVKLLNDGKVFLRVIPKAHLLVNEDINYKLVMQIKHLTDCGYFVTSTKREDGFTKIKSSKNLILNETGFLSVIKRLSKLVKEMQAGNTFDVKDQWVYSIRLPSNNWWLLGNGLIKDQIELIKESSEKEII